MLKYLELSLEQIIEQACLEKLASDDICHYGRDEGD